jgi:tetratricopeptide (TPR) repeat protein
MQARDYPKAIEVYERLNARKPEFWVGANDLAYLLSERSGSSKDLERALLLAKKAQETQPDHPAVLDTLGWIYFKMNDYPAALRFLERAVAKAPESGQLNYHMGMATLKSGKASEAKEYFKKAAESKEVFEGKEEARKMLEQK